MDIKATIDKESFGYRNRLLLIALGAMLYAAWCLYDGMIGYPDQIEAYEAFNQLQADYPDNWRDEWEEVAKDNGWDPTKEPDERTQGDILTQWLQFAIVFPIGAYCLISVGVWSRRYIGADDSTLYGNGGVEVPFDSITHIDANRWERKGIARVYYDSGAGEQSVLIDDFKYQRHPANEVFNRIKAAIDDDKIEGLSDEGDLAEGFDEADSDVS
ncbi:MAG: hypothetical protein AAGB26_17375 [Planctomycetota bacterium]